MQHKLLCSDLDGTLLTTKSDVSIETINQIKGLKNHLRIILVSARMPQSMYYIQKDLGVKNQPIICYNGALVLSGLKQVFSEVIDFKVMEEVYNLAKSLQIKLGLYYNTEWCVEATSERVEKEIKYTKTQPVYKNTEETLLDWKQRNISAHKVMLMCTKESADTIYPILQKNHSNSLQIYRSNDTLIEIAPKTVSKLTAIKKILQPGETMNDVISFGDNYNDIEMLQASGTGVAVGNARDEVKKIANFVTLKNTENGVAHYLKNIL